MNITTSEHRATSNVEAQGPAIAVTYWLTISLLVVVPLAFSTAVYRMYSLPKFAFLLTGASALLPLLIWNTIRSRGEIPRLLTLRHVLLVSLYLILISVSTFLGVSPIATLFGSSYNQMGLITHLCFFTVFASLIVAIGTSEKRFRWTLWAMTLTGLIVATYAYVQFFGRDPFVPSQFYTFESSAGPVLRIISTLGHSNYLGNFLLYVTPLAAGLALDARGSARRIGLATAILSAAAIVFSGTRGAWLGLVTGLLTFVLLARTRRKGDSVGQRRSTVRWALLTSVVILFLSAIIAINPASRNIAKRARLLASEQTGSGRTLLWRDSLKMLAQNPLAGCGPEGFRTAFLPYRSVELARLAPQTNNESSHSSYIDAAISYGLLGTILYVAIIASSFKLLMRARRQSKDAGFRTITASMISSMAAVVVHNLFIFDQISTGLYFFVFAALAQSCSHVVTSTTAAEPDRTVASVNPRAGLDASHRRIASLRPAALFAGAACVLFFAAVWYSISIARADVEINKAIAAATTSDLSGVLRHGKRAISHPDPSGEYRFLLARTLALCGDNLPIVESGERNLAFTLARSHAEASLARTLTPDASYVLLGYLAWRLGDQEKLFGYATKAVETDPNFSNSHWLLAEAHLARAERESAELHAQLALALDPASQAARSALKRAKQIPQAGTPDELIQYARSLASKGKTSHAIRIAQRAINRSAGTCPDCHAILAKLYETAERYSEAISEWEAYQRLTPEHARTEQAGRHIDELKKKVATRGQ